MSIPSACAIDSKQFLNRRRMMMMMMMMMMAKQGNEETENALQSHRPRRFEDLVRRFEYPNPKNRWDAPYFIVRPPGIDVNELRREKDNAKLYEWPADLKPMSEDMEHMSLDAMPQDRAAGQEGTMADDAGELLPGASAAAAVVISLSLSLYIYIHMYVCMPFARPASDHVAGRVIREVVLMTARPSKKKTMTTSSSNSKAKADDENEAGLVQEQRQGRLNPTPATSAEKLSTTNLRHELDRATLQVGR